MSVFFQLFEFAVLELILFGMLFLSDSSCASGWIQPHPFGKLLWKLKTFIYLPFIIVMFVWMTNYWFGLCVVFVGSNFVTWKHEQSKWMKSIVMGGGEVEMAHHLAGYNHFNRSTLLVEWKARLHSVQEFVQSWKSLNSTWSPWKVLEFLVLLNVVEKGITIFVQTTIFLFWSPINLEMGLFKPLEQATLQQIEARPGWLHNSWVILVDLTFNACLY